MTTTDCTGNVTRMVTLTDIPTDSYPGRYVTVDITRCNACPGSAFVTDDNGYRWKLDLPADFVSDDYMSAYWAAETTLYTAPFYTPPEPEPVFGPELPPTDEELEAMYEAAEADYLAEVASERAYAEMLERRAENGTWFGVDEYAEPF